MTYKKMNIKRRTDSPESREFWAWFDSLTLEELGEEDIGDPWTDTSRDLSPGLVDVDKPATTAPKDFDKLQLLSIDIQTLIGKLEESLRYLETMRRDVAELCDNNKPEESK